MESMGIAGLIAAYVALAIVLLCLLLYARLPWWVKGAAIAAVSAFYYASYVSYPKLLGWPTPYGLPQRVYIVAVTVEEPEAIYFWARDLTQGLRVTRPRAYKLPYTKKLHEKVENVTRKLRRAIPVIGELSGGNVGPDGGEGVFSTPSDIELNFIDAPEALIPGKE
ncbi:MAG: hypothetical protein NW215_08870 [Hyphomicrobiales bacterium]|nr:hypothetical protein [Hyphomicrobiales bacterium]